MEIKNNLQFTRKLASVQIIKKIRTHPNADKLDLAIINGWQVVIKRNEFSEEDKVVFFEIDSKLPNTEWSKDFEKQKFKVQSIMIRKELSQGLILPLSILQGKVNIEELNEGDDLTDLLNIVKYEDDSEMTMIINNEQKEKKKVKDQIKKPNTKIDGKKIKINQSEEVKNNQNPINMEKKEKIKSNQISKFPDGNDPDIDNRIYDFPCHLGIPKTDEPRIQSNLEILDYMKNKAYYSSIKYDGTSATYIFDIYPNNNPANIQELNDEVNEDKIKGNFPYKFLVCSRNLVRNDDVYKRGAEIYDIKNKLAKAGFTYAIQCEIYGPKVAKNPLNMKSLKIAVFNVLDIENRRYFDLEEMEEFCAKYELPIVDIEEKGDSFNYTLEDLKEKSKGFYHGTNNNREGLVFRAQKNWNFLFDNDGQFLKNLKNLPIEEMKQELEKYRRLSFKIINDQYLI